MSIFDITKEDDMSVGQPVSNTLGPQGLSGQAAQAMPSKPPPEGIEVGMDMLKRLEPDLTLLPMEFMICSIAVSLRNISDKLSALVNVTEQGNYGQRDSLAKIADAVTTVGSHVSSVRSDVDQIAKAKREALQDMLSRTPY